MTKKLRRRTLSWQMPGSSSHVPTLVSVLAFLVVTVGCAKPALASLISLNSKFGAGTLTLDSETGFRWLDLPLTVDIGYDEVQREFGNSGRFQGFRYASAIEVQGLLEDSGILIPPGGAVASAELYNPIVTLQSFIGITLTVQPGGPLFGVEKHSWGLSSSTDAPPQLFAPEVYVHDPGIADPQRYGLAIIPNHTSSSADSRYGSWLIEETQSDAVPEPPVILLVTSGVLAFCVHRWGRSRRFPHST